MEVTRDSNGHEWRNNSGLASYDCLRCGLGDYEADGTGACRGRRTFTCGTQSNGHTHGTCLALFNTRAEASVHYSAEHMTQAQRDDYAAYVVALGKRQARMGY
jgi:hypothetical protein